MNTQEPPAEKIAAVVTAVAFLDDTHRDEPIRAELLGPERLEAHARALAAAAEAVVTRGRPLLKYFDASSTALVESHRQISAAHRTGEIVGTEAEWLLDNYHIVAEALREVRCDLPPGYYRLLPKLTAGPLAGFPRVYALALDLIAHCDSGLDENNTLRFVQAYQTVVTLTIGELWAVPTMLRLGLVENLRRLAGQVIKTHSDRRAADAWAQSLLTGSPSPVQPPRTCSPAFLLHLIERLRVPGQGDGGALAWLEGILAESGLTPAEVQRREQQRQAANQVSIGNCVTSLRLVSALEWTAFFDRTSAVEAVLRHDPAGVYTRQDFATRDRCRRAVERLARGCDMSEPTVAQWAIGLARRPGRPPRDHVGCYLIGDGQEELERQLRYQPVWSERLPRAVLRRPRTFYFGALALVAAALLAGLTGLAWPATVLAALGLCLAALLPISELAAALVNRFFTALVPPRVLPKLEFPKGLPEDCPTFVVIPAMLIRPASARTLLERLEIHYLSSLDPQFRFALLTDFADAPAEHMPEDEEYLRAALEGVRALNERYCAGGPDRFFVCHRHRQWNPVQGCWMGWERKRGKLTEFNRLLRGDPSTSFTAVGGNLASLPRIRFVLTLDADTQLPREAAQRLIATLAHPLNQPRFDPDYGRVVAGYGILQPRITMSLTGAMKSRFARVFGGSAGIDPYSTASSDVYQDLFGVGSFTGKGLYDVDAFEAATGKTFPENQILSHDLIEGNFARCGLATDVELLDEYPTRYTAYARREHRWVRGDWQILPWLFRQVPTGQPGEPRRHNSLPAVERWKIFDNLRRSLVPPALVLMLALGWTVLPGSPWLWSALAALVCGGPLFLQLGEFAGRWLRALLKGRPRPELPDQTGATVAQVLLGAAFLADQARLMVDAVARTLTRLFLTRRHLLEWETAAATERRLGNDFPSFLRSMAPTPLLAAGLAGAVAWVAPDALPAALPWLLAWFASPLLAWWVSQPSFRVEPPLEAGQQRQLFRLARQTWSFFETFVGDEDNWLPPDNYQEDPKGEVAHRTSPTNIGLYLLANLAAHDFGYLTLSGMVERLEKSFATLDRLERSHGHFYNWYDTKTLKPLQPIYLSTVDSGNLLASFLALKQGLLEKAAEAVPAPAAWRGLVDTLELARDALQGLVLPGKRIGLDLVKPIQDNLEELARHFAEEPTDPAGWNEGLRRLDEAANRLQGYVQRLGRAIGQEPRELRRWTVAFAELVRQLRAEHDASADAIAGLRQHCRQLADRCAAFAAAVDFKVLYNEPRNLFSVGFNLTQGRLDNAHYDLLASEAGLTSFLAVARGDAPRKHWFQLGRPLTHVGDSVALVSWGGTMFEYLMPRLFLTSIPGTLLDASQRAAVARQIEYGRQRHVPWGISESAFAVVDADFNYQYQAFGVPGLGLKRGLVKDLVVAPYATALAVGVAPQEVVRNLDYLAREGGLGAYGFYEAIDYTPERMPAQTRSTVVKCFMAHHQGMSLLALANYQLHDPLPRRLHAEPMVRATELLLQERVPQDVPLVHPHRDEVGAPAQAAKPVLLRRRLTTPHTVHPRTHLLGSGEYSVVVTNSGAGRSLAGGIDVTRWREDRTCDAWGQFCYVRDEQTGRTWSAGYQPLRTEAEEYEVLYSTDKAEFRRRDGSIETHLEITVSPENRAEVRRLTLTNHDNEPHELELTSYAEIVLAPHAVDLAHPAFGKLFLETEFIAAEEALLARRRPRGPEQKPVWGVHVVAVDGQAVGPVQFETDRGRFLGRGRTPANPVGLEEDANLSGTVGPVLDPIFCLRRRVLVPPESSVGVAFTTAVADTREEALALADQYHDFHAVQRAFELAWAHSQLELRHLRLAADETHLYQRLAAHVVFAGPAMRAAPEILATNRLGQSALWRHGISGDNPIVLVHIGDDAEMPLVRHMLAAHCFWRTRGLVVDLVILNNQEGGYFEDLHKDLQALTRSGDERLLLDKPGGVFLRRASHMPREDRLLLDAAARCVLHGQRGPVVRQLDRLERVASGSPPPLVRVSSAVPGSRLRDAADPDLQFFNSWGGFSADGREFVICLAPRGGAARFTAHETHLAPPLPPAPWINVVANPVCGFLVSESGGGCTWAGNSQTNRLTPWNNDPVSDPPGEVVYLRDEATGEIWTPTPLPLGGNGPQRTRHGQGYSIFEQERDGLAQELLLFVPRRDPVKVVRLRIRNRGNRLRRLTVTYYAEWVLGTVRDQAALNVVTAVEPATGAILAHNAFNADFGSHVAFADADPRPRSFTADRTEFLGRNGAVASPAGLAGPTLSGSTGAGTDPCAALQVALELQPGQEGTVAFFLGQAPDVEAAKTLLRHCREPGWVDAAYQEVRQQWDQFLNTVQVETPNHALDLLLNRWLPYQVLSCRVWGRSAFYQSGGAYGFRDQLQDGMALVYGAPAETRAHLLRAAGRQFVEGDVQHWWHPPTGVGVRTRFSDDFLWLPFAVSHYLATTGDRAVLDEKVPFLQAPPLGLDQEDDYRLPEISSEVGTLYEHCVRAVEKADRLGAHGLPLMGTGDWNDGMNRVGHQGRGESIWNAWFAIAVLGPMGELANQRGDADRAEAYRQRIQQLQIALEKHGWDGGWYRRAYFDDGTPLGSAQNTACRIDSLPQTWAVISGAAQPDRASTAMAAVEEMLVKTADKLILLFTPPFDGGELEPGYIKGYVPGIRENGGQYTHAAIWVVQAMAALGKGTRTEELLHFLNPIAHAGNAAEVDRYRVEPYVLAGDVAGAAPHIGRGGWTWYTGAAGWFYRVALEHLLGFKLQGDHLEVDPCLPAAWKSFTLTYRHRTATYRVQVLNPDGVERGVREVTCDGQPMIGFRIALADDAKTHDVQVRMG